MFQRWCKILAAPDLCLTRPADSITPSEEEIFQKFNPELQARNLALRDERRKNQQAFLDQLKEYSKSDKNMWVAEKEAQAKAREELVRREAEEKAFQGRISEEMRAQARAR